MTDIFETIIRLSFSAGWLIAAVVVVRFLGKKIPKKYICVLWLLVGIRLVFPFHIESSWSLIPNVNEVALRDIRLFYYNQVWVEKEQPEVVKVGPFQKEVRAGVTYISEEGEQDTGLAAEEREEAGVRKALQGFLQKNLAPITLMNVFMWVWTAGIVVMLGYFAFSLWYLKRKLSEAVLLEDNIWQSEYVASPFVFGLLQPKIYIPYHMTEEEHAHVLVHEKIHLRRKDNWLKAVAFGIVCVYWFHPLVWIAYSLLCRDMEMACDEQVVSYMDEDTRRKYSLALLTCRSKRTWYHTSPIGFGEVEIRERVLRIKHYREPSASLVMTAVVLCIGAALCFWTNVKPQYPVSGNLPSWEDADMEPEPKETRKVYENGDMDGNGIAEYHVWQQAEESPEQDEQVTFYWNEEPIFTYQAPAMVRLHQAEYVDLDKDGQKEIWILLYTYMTDQYGNYKGHPKIFLLKQEQGQWKNWKTFQQGSQDNPEFPVSMEIGEASYSIVICCEGAKVKAVYDANERYENLKFSDSVHKEMWDQIDQMKTWPSGQAFGSLDKEYNGFMLYNYKGNSCLISRYELSGLNENDWLGYVDIFFDYDANGQVRILDLGFYPRTS